jgi:hypothetical protein
MKSMNMISTTGRRPTSAAPTPNPVMAASLMGLERTRSGPNSSSSPRVTPKTPPWATSSPRISTAGSARMPSASAARIASA